MPYVTAPDDRYLVAVGDRVKKGDVVEVDDETAASLVEQGWEPAKAPKSAKGDGAPVKADTDK